MLQSQIFEKRMGALTYASYVDLKFSLQAGFFSLEPVQGQLVLAWAEKSAFVLAET